MSRVSQSIYRVRFGACLPKDMSYILVSGSFFLQSVAASFSSSKIIYVLTSPWRWRPPPRPSHNVTWKIFNSYLYEGGDSWQVLFGWQNILPASLSSLMFQNIGHFMNYSINPTKGVPLPCSNVFTISSLLDPQMLNLPVLSPTTYYMTELGTRC